ncbi:hypothetical protein RBG61_10015 [Paludicola sp. MB14-C6]|uniref:hypothetical protein n=1 Tax=Paludihabitans sp. MB14-C6 TaxID=3070656 RepID=UPI0027DE1726|nr:hypothetical protein [Paludicola sp. MB14-C6]WMJ22322.1 hypothetical protein RBG61_10015 [Paludicola sp. MB14-C6]
MRLFKENKPNRKPLLISIAALLVIVAYCIFTFANVSKSTTQEKMNITQQAIERAVVNCYALEGFYPSNIEYLENNYGVLIDHKKYVILYETVGSNVRPYVEVVQRGNTM